MSVETYTVAQTKSADTLFKTRDIVTYVAGGLLILGGLNWLVVALNKQRRDLFDYLLPGDGRKTSRATLQQIVYILVGIAAIVLLMNFIVPRPPNFLNRAFFPQTLVAPSATPPNADAAATLTGLKPGTRIVYWASEKTQSSPSGASAPPMWNEAYGEYQNSGAVEANEKGEALVQMRTPIRYRVPGYSPKLHFHYRELAPLDSERKSASIWSDVKTAYIGKP